MGYSSELVEEVFGDVDEEPTITVTYDIEKNLSLTDTLYAQTEKYGEQLLKSLDMNLSLGMERKKPRERTTR